MKKRRKEGLVFKRKQKREEKKEEKKGKGEGKVGWTSPLFRVEIF